jgi:branched-chain amino acid transport system substrate-binding protein
MKFPGVEAFLEKYRQRSSQAGVDPLGLYIPPFAYAEMQVIEQSILATGTLDDEKLANHMRSTKFQTVVGEVQFGKQGEWAEPRILTVQYRGIVGNDVDQFRQPGKQVILCPDKYKSGDLVHPFEPVGQ